jgi:hypothetical protein
MDGKEHSNSKTTQVCPKLSYYWVLELGLGIDGLINSHVTPSVSIFSLYCKILKPKTQEKMR